MTSVVLFQVGKVTKRSRLADGLLLGDHAIRNLTINSPEWSGQNRPGTPPRHI